MQSNSVNGQPEIANITVVTDERQVIVPQAITSVVEVNNPGPQGPVGPQGEAGPSEPFVNIGNGVYATTSSLQVTGSFLVSGSSTFTNIGPAIFSGSVNATSGVTMSSALVSGDVTVLGTASINVLQINTTINSTGSNTLGDAPNDTQTLYGSVVIPTGSLTVSGAAQITGNINLPNQYQYIGMGINDAIRFANGEVRVSTSTTTGNFSVYSPSYGLTAFRVIANGNTLIGTTTDSGYRLDVVSGSIRSLSTSSFAYNRIETTVSAGSLGVGMEFKNGANTTTIGANATRTYIYSGQGSTENFTILHTGNVGIGTTAPATALDVVGYARTSQGYKFSQSTNGQFTISSGNTYFDYEGGFSFRSLPTYNTTMYVSASIVGIGTTAPSAKLHISGSTSEALLVASSSAGPALYVSGSGNVGIGTTTPTKRLEVYDAASGDGLAIVRSAVTTQRIELIPNDSTVSTLIKGGGNGKPFYIASWANGGTAQPLYFGTNYSNGIDQVRMTIDTTGSVGIGTITPAYKLDVSGSTRINGTINMSGSLTDNNLIDYSGSAYGTRFRLRDWAWNLAAGVSLDSNNIFLNPSGELRVQGGYTIIQSTATTIGGGYPSLTTRLTVQGSGATSATNALLIQNSSAASLAYIDNSGQAFFNNRVCVNRLQPFTSADIIEIAGGIGSATGGSGIGLNQFTNVTNTSGTHNRVESTGTFLPTSGTGVFNAFQIAGTINQTGGANGITRGLFINPTITAAANFRAIETTAGNVLFQSGSTPLMLVSSSGVVSIGLSGSAYGSTGISNGRLTINNTSGNNGLAIRTGETGYQLGIRTTVNDAIGAEFVWHDGATFTFLQHGGAIGTRLGTSGYAQFRANFLSPDGTATIHTGASNLERFRVTNAGLVGVNTSSSISAQFQVKGSGTTNATTTFLLQNSTPTNLLSVLDNGQVSFTSPTMSLAVSQSAFSISPIISASNVVGGQYYGVNITPTFFQTTGSQTETAFRVAATFSQSSAAATSGTNIIADFGSTSAGSQLTVTDVTSGSIYMVNDVSGIPIIEATSNWDVNIYDFPNKIFEKTGSQVNIYGTMRVSGSFILPLSQSAAPQIGSAYWSGSLLFIYNGTRYMSSSFA